ncbi:MAG: hypothetical protein M3Q42_10255 [Pseudomonadota bacterium]|nr:hypothetical protein [Pseudomonadota bacterium]
MNDAITHAAQTLAAKAPHLAVGAGPLLEAWVALELGAQLNTGNQKVRVATMEADGSIAYDETYYVRITQRTSIKAPFTSWLEFAVGRRRYEIHNSVRLLGLSQATHEADVCLMSVQGLYPRGLPYAVIECKNYKRGSMPCNAVRALVVVRADVPSALSSQWCVVSTTTRTLNAKRIGNRFGIRTFGNVVPARGHANIALIVADLPKL